MLAALQSRGWILRGVLSLVYFSGSHLASAAPIPLHWHSRHGTAELQARIEQIRLVPTAEAQKLLSGFGSAPLTLHSGPYSSDSVPEVRLALPKGVRFWYPILASSYPPGAEPLALHRGERVVLQYRPNWPTLRLFPAQEHSNVR